MDEKFKKVETVEHPQHYNQGNIECIDAMESAFGVDEVSSFCKLNAFKYLWRAGDKINAVEDLKKARWYIDKIIEIQTRDV